MRAILLICLSLLSLNLSYPQDHQKKTPNVKLEDLDGKKVQLKSYLGKGPVLISFWATWCKPCQEELAEYQKIYNDYKSKGFQMLGISIDDEKTVAKVKPYIKSKNYNFTVLLDSNSDAAREFYVQDVPNTFLVDKKGNIVSSHHGYKRGDELELKKNIEELLK
ncbi:MAG: TlpA disulfide reductase family protein [Ignavibacteriaceae bacterium]|nr:TlpA disulfide reductase family protein [Ignavibacteriaceae bacterium]